MSEATASDAVACLVCGARAWGARLEARERQFGLPGSFTYATCTACGSLQLLDPPADLAPYYPSGYYSFDGGDDGGLVARIKAAASRYGVTGHGIVGRAAAMVAPPPTAGMHAWLARAGATATARILDVGSGGGALLRALDAAGYAHLTGVDPFLGGDARVGRVSLRRSTVEQLAREAHGAFDLVMIHHALEHVPAPRETLAAMRALLAPGGHCLVRVPLAPSWALERYADRWVQLDAPRHLVIPSERGLVALAAEVGLALDASRHDSEAIQVWGSELYRRDVTLSAGAREVGWLAKQRGRRFARRANAARRGDQGAFLFRAV
ncbi:class I SAM-dependent methyltransferase [Roseisolibacter agri]|uniref:Methyltransferase n=1 Tax=Roseisolibacter agri TaxID=2014610 RepID=A0AA37VCA2_9BACT|nr:class I SAM-dependent methyltransferase [Roseisolibacter agri]GLC27463.1 putative methyltransferase [Roseisolibacter agri]